ncbi:MAG: penicillin-binding protein [Actinomycetales bacterium]
MSRSDSAPGLAKVTSLLAAFTATSLIAGVLTGGLLLPAVGAAGESTQAGIDFFEGLPGDFQVSQPSQQSRILWADGSEMATFYYENRILVPLASVAPVMRQAIVAIEDNRFYEHSGADPKGILRAAVNNAAGQDTQGASTLTQQWIKNVLLNEALAAKDEEAVKALQTPDKARKVREIKLALSAEKTYSKDEILQNYLNIALFGDGQYGVQTASRHFFSKDASQLNLEDAALLAGMVQSPTRWNPLRNPEGAQERRDIVLGEMLRFDMITQEQYDASVAVPVAAQLHEEETQNGCSYAGSAAYFCDYITWVIRNDEAFGPDEASRLELLYGGGLTITTTLDPDKQAEAQRAVTRRSISKRRGVGVALSSVDSTTGQIVAMAQNRTYTTKADAPSGSTAINYNVDQAYGGGVGFQVGSTYKPFTLATWLASGRSLNDTVDAGKYNRRFRASCIDSVSRYSPGNSEGGGAGRMSVLQATYNSVNTAYAAMASRLDLCDIRDTAMALGVHKATGGEPDVNPSSFLGTNDIAPLTMASAYGGFANGGIYCKPVAILEVKDSQGQVLPKPEPDCHEALDPAVVSQVNAALSQVLIRGTAKRVGGIGRAAGGKTGTANDSMETWFVGFAAGGLSTAVWVGTPDRSPKRLGGVYGATYAAPIWRDYMVDAVRDMPAQSFASVTRSAEKQQEVTVPRVVGLDEDEARSAIQDQELEDGPTVEVDSPEPQGTIIGTSPASGSRVTNGTEIRIQVSNGNGG